MNDPFQEAFPLKSASEWIEESKQTPNPRRLFGDFWCEGELAFLFADTNVGKSILVVQIANAISKGEPTENFELETEKQGVIYFDFELTAKQFEHRYSNNFESYYPWDSNFKRAQMNQGAKIPDGCEFNWFVNTAIEKAIVETGIKVVIIDNLTYLTTNGGNAKGALDTMRNLNQWKVKYGLSILVLAHTPKRNQTKPITANDLTGSKNLMNFCDSAFAIGQSNKDHNLKYLKQIKQRNSHQTYDSENVWIGEITKPDNFLKFQFLKFGSELEHLKAPKAQDQESLALDILQLHSKGLSLRQIGEQLGVSHMKVSRSLKNWLPESVTSQPLQVLQPEKQEE